MLMIQKQRILNIKNVYTANAFRTEKGIFIGAGSETEPYVVLYYLTSNRTNRISDCPGGLMSFIPVPGQSQRFVTIMGLFPPFIGREAGLFLHENINHKWKTSKAMELPFAHRCEFVSHGNKNFLAAATVSRFKDNPADWSRPGEIHIIPVGEQEIPWKSQVINTGIRRNHGMTKAIIDGKEILFVSGEEGIFSITHTTENRWILTPVFEKEVSEMTFIDLDGDGNMELVTIEPFHGTSLNIYKKTINGWILKYSDSLSFGHGLSSGIFKGNPVIVAGNRSDSLALETFTIDNLDKGLVNRIVIEEEAGPTQTQVFSDGSVDYIMSANQKKNEVALYT